MKTAAFLAWSVFFFSADVWAWDPVGAGGPGRHTYASAFDSSRGHLLVFGGSDGHAFRNETFALDLATSTWTEVQVSGASPSPRRLVEGIYDPVRDRLVVFGGIGDDGFHNDVWALSLSGPPTWTNLAPMGPGPSPRAGHAVVYDPARHRMILFGGFDPSSPTESRRNDVWVLSLTGRPTWRRLVTSGVPPTPRSSHSMVYDDTRRRLLVFGGSDTSLRNDVWALSLDGFPTWRQIAAQGDAPAAREEQAAIYDPVRQRLVVFWGYGAVDGVDLDDVWGLSLAGLPTWTQITPEGAQPYAWGHGAVYDASGDRVVEHGGQFALNQTWALGLAEASSNLDPGALMPRQ